MNQNNNWFLNFIKDIMKSKYYFFTCVAGLSLFLIIGLTSVFVNFGGDFETSTFTSWFHKNEMIQSSKTPYRGLASATPDFACLSDGIRLENLKKDIQFLETQMDSGKGVTGDWKSISLETIPTPQAQFILDYKKLIGQVGSNNNYSQCVDLPCVLNTIYKDKTQLSGYLSYFWYLKTGTMLSMSDKVVGSNIARSSFSEYLFSKNELVNFWKLAKSLPNSFLHIPGLKSIHKIPTTHTVSGFDKNHCSISLGSGELLFKSNCLGAQNNDFFVNVSSAMAKQVDLNGEHRKSFSKSSEWANLSKWNFEEYWIEKYKTYAQSWFTETPATYFVTKNAATHPSRQFSETLANFRYSSDQLSNLHNDVKSFVSANFFDHHSYDKEGLLRKYLRHANNLWDNKEKHFWSQCLDQHFTVEHIDKVGTNKKSFEVMNSKLFTCMDSQIPGFVSQVLSSIKKREFEGCNFFNIEKYQDEADRFLELLSKNINKKIFKVHFDLEKWGVQLLIGLKVKKEIDNEIDPTSLYVSCYFNQNMEQCYNNKLKNTTHHILNQYSQMHPDFLGQLVEEVQSNYRFIDVKELSDEKAKKFLFPYYAKLRSESEQVWQTCKDRSLSEGEEFDFPMSFNAGQFYVHPTLLNCINDKIDTIAMDTIDEPLVIEQASHEIVEFELTTTEKKFASFFLDKRVAQYFKEFIRDEAESESKLMADYFVKNSNSLIDVVMKSKDFLDEIYSRNQIQEKCIELMRSNYPEKYWFHTQAQLTSKYGDSICNDILNDDKIKRTVANTIGQEWSKVRSRIVGNYKESYQSILDSCYDRYPTQLSIHFVKNSRLRRSCMQKGHAKAVEIVLEAWQNTDEAKYFKSMETSLKKELHALKEVIIKDMRKTDRVISSEK
jgi:hypothetical protein